MHATSQKLLALTVALVSAGLLTGCQPQPISSPDTNQVEMVQDAPVTSESETTAQTTEYQFVAEEDGQTAADVLAINSQVEYIDYDFGQFVQAINGLAGNADYYWAFSVNGVSANQSVDNTVLQAGDTIEFVYQAVSDFEMTE